MATTRKKDPKLDMIKRNADYLARKPFVRIGVFGDEGKETKEGTGEQGAALTVAQVATFHEFGTENVPERSFLRATIQQDNPELRDFTSALYRKVMRGEIEAKRALALLGKKAESLVRARIRAGIEPELAESTIRAKGSSKPLIDTGQLINSITSEVKDG